MRDDDRSVYVVFERWVPNAFHFTSQSQFRPAFCLGDFTASSVVVRTNFPRWPTLEAPLGGFSGPQVESLWLQFGKCSPGPPKSRHWVPGYVPGEAPWGRQLRQQFASCPPQSHHTAPQWNASHTPLLKQISPLAGDDEPRRQALGGHVPTGPLPSPLQGHHVHCGQWSWWPWGCSFGDHVPSACRVGMHSSKILGLPPGWTWQSVGL